MSIQWQRAGALKVKVRSRMYFSDRARVYFWDRARAYFWERG